ncbi:MAG: hypothetical protein ACOYD3_13130 [Kiritimatiellia bacterium]|jgi:hypothetical protein
MVLTEQQQQDVRRWLAEGASLADVQKRLLEEHQVSMTYMDVRLMVLELGATVQDKPEPKKPIDAVPDASDDGFADDGAGDASAGGVSVTIDRVVQAGALASGTVTFSDGVSANWMLDQMGRLGLSNVSQAGYRPSSEDVQAFQVELQNKLASGGY